MLTLAECRKVARDYLATLFSDAVLYEEPVHHGDYGYVFSYQSKKYLQSGDMADAIIGNSPLLIDKNSHQVYVLTSGKSVEPYVENYLACGDPFRFPGKCVKLVNCLPNAEKVKAIQVIRKHTDLVLAESKSIIERCLAGQPGLVQCQFEDEAAQLVEELAALGFVSIQLRD